MKQKRAFFSCIEKDIVCLAHRKTVLCSRRNALGCSSFCRGRHSDPYHLEEQKQHNEDNNKKWTMFATKQIKIIENSKEKLLQ
jgi:hypothetical protein